MLVGKQSLSALTPSPSPALRERGDHHRWNSAASLTSRCLAPLCRLRERGDHHRWNSAASSASRCLAPLSPPAGEGSGERASGSNRDVGRQAEPQRPHPQPLSRAAGEGRPPSLEFGCELDVPMSCSPLPPALEFGVELDIPMSCSPLPRCGRGVGGEGRRFKSRCCSASRASTPSPPAPLPRCGRGETTIAGIPLRARHPDVLLPSPACGRGVGGEGQRFKSRCWPPSSATRPAAEQTALPDAAARCVIPSQPLPAAPPTRPAQARPPAFQPSFPPFCTRLYQRAATIRALTERP
ncbi:hypothetical protein EPAKOI_004938 [Cupriavidus sp. H18C2]